MSGAWWFNQLFRLRIITFDGALGIVANVLKEFVASEDKSAVFFTNEAQPFFEKGGIIMLTYRQLKELVPETPRGKISDKGEILFSSEEHGAKIVIFKNGYLTYTRNDGFGDPCTTAYSVHQCSQIVYKSGCSKSEFDEECGYYGEHCKLIYRITNGQLTRFAIISEEAYLDDLNDREKRRMEPLNDDDYHFDESEAWLGAVIKHERDIEQHKRLIRALKKLTDIQRNTIELFFGNEIMTERKAAQILGISHQSVHDNRVAAMKRLRKIFEV